ncbi:MAG: hypothetical protein KZQ57_05120, partial [gamma proteobacterium symbiont of Lucinoma myriamae]|nr:hypothetical protein [gamma proteobacterium symbiont of Lucinoma myriamae]
FVLLACSLFNPQFHLVYMKLSVLVSVTTSPSPAEDGEGFVHINRGIHGIGDLAADVYDWHNPVAKITITRVRDHD